MFLEIAQNGKNHIGRYLIVIITLIVAFIFGQVPLMTLVDMSAYQNTQNFELIGVDSNFGLLLMLLSFVFAFFALLVMVPLAHKRSFRTLVNPFDKIRWGRIFFGFTLWFGLMFLTELFFYFSEPHNYVFNFDGRKFLILLLISLLILPLQTSFEELFFRGYLMQGLSLFFPSRMLPLLLTSLLFGLVHIMNPEVEAYGTNLMLTYYCGIGFFLGLITLLDNGLELALGVHAATNIYSACFVTYEASVLQTAALFKLQRVDINFVLLFAGISAVIFLLICFSKYNWSFAREAGGEINTNRVVGH